MTQSQQQQYYYQQMMRRQSLLAHYNRLMNQKVGVSGQEPEPQEEAEIPETGLEIPATVIPTEIAKVTLKATEVVNQTELSFEIEKKQEINQIALGFIFQNQGTNTTGKYLKPYLNSDFVLCSTVTNELDGKYIKLLKFKCAEESKTFWIFAENDILKKEEQV